MNWRCPQIEPVPFGVAHQLHYIRLPAAVGMQVDPIAPTKELPWRMTLRKL